MSTIRENLEVELARIRAEDQATYGIKGRHCLPELRVRPYVRCVPMRAWSPQPCAVGEFTQRRTRRYDSVLCQVTGDALTNPRDRKYVLEHVFVNEPDVCPQCLARWMMLAFRGDT